jgi:hypothetical protein
MSLGLRGLSNGITSHGSIIRFVAINRPVGGAHGQSHDMPGEAMS